MKDRYFDLDVKKRNGKFKVDFFDLFESFVSFFYC